MPSVQWMAFLFVITCSMRWMLSGSNLVSSLMVFPHFKSPLNDIRELKEQLYTYEQTQKFFSGPTEVGQSELLLHFINRIYQASGKQDFSLQILLASFEMANILVQLFIFYKAYAITQKKENDTNMALYFIMFNPISLLGGFNNLASFNDFLWHLMILAPLTEILS